MNVKVGSCPDSWGVWFADDPKQIPWTRFLDEVVEAGYEWIELGPWGYMPKDIKRLRPEIENRGLKVSANFIWAHLEDPDDWPRLEEQLLGVGEHLATFGAEYLIVFDDLHTDWFTGEQLRPQFLDDDGWKQLIATVHKVADIARREFGLQLCFHSTSDSHVAYAEEIERLLEDTDPERVVLAQDIGHLAYRGADPVEFVRKHHERIPYLHLKSVDPDLQQRVEDGEIPFIEAVEMGIFCDLDRGKVDLVAFKEMLEEIDFDGFAIVEQDMHPVAWDKPLPIAKRNRAYLREIGIG
jgi:inosose dehydratase